MLGEFDQEHIQAWKSQDVGHQMGQDPIEIFIEKKKKIPYFYITI